MLVSAIGWPRVYVDALEERLDVEGFRLAGESYTDERLWSWWQANNLDVESSLAHLEALIHGVSYVTISAPGKLDDPDMPVIRVESPTSMVADIDPRTRKVRRALRLYVDELDPTQDAATLYLPNETIYFVRRSGAARWRIESRVRHQLGVVPVIPIINRERLSDRVGRSEITPEVRSMTDAAARIMMNLQATAELMAVPQRLLFGVAQDEFAANPENPGAVLEAYYARILAFENEAGRAEQFQAAELRNFVEALGELAKHVASYTGLPPQYLSFQSDNPASAEAIRSSESRLVKKSERKARMFGSAWEEVMRVAMLIMDQAIPKNAYRMETIWRDPSTPTYSAKADAVGKLYAAGMGVIPLEQARIDLGYSAEQRRQMRDWDNQNPTAQLNALLSGPRLPAREPAAEAA
ncbi:Phage portal protein, SPP1 Gp6-like [Lentzea flava]|nr:Phage portal protein, SPP1 Gp6-like [Lentzea flava]